MSDQQLRDEAITLFLAGHETTALALAHTLLPAQQAPRRRAAPPRRDRRGARRPPADRRRRARARLHRRVLKESMRLYPPAWTTGREVAEAVEIGGYLIPKGAQILTSQWVVHRDPRWFPNPEGFDPDRWAPGARGGPPAVRLLPVRRRPARLHRQPLRNHGGDARAGDHRAALSGSSSSPVSASRSKPSVTLRQEGPGLRCGSASARRRGAPSPCGAATSPRCRRDLKPARQSETRRRDAPHSHSPQRGPAATRGRARSRRSRVV